MLEVWIPGKPSRPASNIAHAEILVKEAFRADAGDTREVFIVRLTREAGPVVVRTVRRGALH